MTDGVFDPSAFKAPAPPPAPSSDFAFNPKAGIPAPVTRPVPTALVPGSGLIPTWSATLLKKYETCAYSAYLEKVKKVSQGEDNVASNRGTALHDIAECFVKAEEQAIKPESEPFLKEWEAKIYPKFRIEFDQLRDDFASGTVEVEGNWGYNVNWEPTGWLAPDVWLRAKLDALHWQSDTCAKIVDFKSGKKFGNEIPHAQQAMIYAIAAFMRFEQLEFAETDFWYLDHGLFSPQRYSRQQAAQFAPRITQRATVMTSATEFPPTPSKSNCMWCPYAKNEECEWRMV